MSQTNSRGAISRGSITITPIVEQQGPFFEAREFFPLLTEDVLEQNRSWMEPTYLDTSTGKLILCVQSYLVRTRHHTILVDTCVGNHKPRPARKMWDMMASDRYERNLAAAGASVDDVDFVMCTHLHVDHVGWNTRLVDGRWVPTFPNARYLFSRRELAFFTDRHASDPTLAPWMTDSVLPIVQAGRADLVQSDHAFDDDVHLRPTPGHTIDHYAVEVGRGDNRALITGDMIHSPIQARYPELGCHADYDVKQSAETRRRVFEQICDTPTLLCTCHFPAPSTGRVRRWAEGFRFEPVTSGNIYPEPD